MALKKPTLGKTTGPPATAAERHDAALDRYDVAILNELQADARLSNTELAARIGLSAAPTWRRVKWLEEQGYITGYRAEIDRRRIGLGVLAFVRVDAERNNAEATRALEDGADEMEKLCAFLGLDYEAMKRARAALRRKGVAR